MYCGDFCPDVDQNFQMSVYQMCRLIEVTNITEFNIENDYYTYYVIF